VGQEQPLRIALLGTVRAFRSDRELAVGPPRHRAVLAMLALRANRVVSRDDLVDGVWPADPPASVVNGVHVIVGALRRALEPDRARRAPGQVLASVGSGYRLVLAPGQLDVEVFDGRLRQARASLHRGAPAEALRAFDDALVLCRGTALTGVPGPYAAAERERLTQVWLAALEARAEALIELGDLAPAAAELGALVAAHPTRERLRALLMVSLYRAGRQAEALAVFTRTRELLRAELGIEPGPELRRLHLDMLGGREVAVSDRPAAGTRDAAHRVVPRQLPPAVRHFAGRRAELKVLAGLVEVARGPRPAVVIAVIDGTAGVGKTTLAVCWAHQAAEHFPDGQLYVNLRGFDPEAAPMPTAEAVRGFLDALAVPSGQLPASPQAQVDLYRSLLADRRVLVVLDNAATAEQVRPLLPGSPTCLVLITSRNRLAGLVAMEGAHPLRLDVLTADEAHDQLANHLGPARVAGEPRAVDEIIAWSAGLPLALAIVAGRAAARPGFPLAVLADELREARGDVLDSFRDADVATDVRAVFSWSYTRLGAAAARLFRLLGLHPGPDLAVPAAASLAGLPRSELGPPLAELARANLVAEQVPGRLGCHDLLRTYAAEQAEREDGAGQRHEAVRRLIDHYLRTAYAGARLLNPHRDPVDLPAPADGVVPEELADHRQALDWFTAERAVLLAVVERAARDGFDIHVLRLAWCLAIFFQRRGHWQDWATAQCAAVAAADRLGDRSGAAHARRDLARAYIPQGRFDDAHDQLTVALDLFRACGDSHGQGQSELNLGILFDRQGRYREALRHTRRALRRFRASGNELMQARAHGAVGWLRAQLGQYPQAIADCRQALCMLEALDDRFGQATVWDSLGYAHQHLGDHQEAIASHRQALDLRRHLGDRSTEATALTHLGEAYRAAGDHDAAREAWRQALTILEQLHLPGADDLRRTLGALDR
jgi:DNA-binding SARP family transcriptional activator/Tfp pilus assembly protein PilF